MDNALKGLILAAGTVITCIVVSLGFFIARGARDTATAAYGQMNKLNAEFNESDKIMYDGLPVPGSEVINVINKYRNEVFSVMVVTKKSTNTYNYNMTIDGSNVGNLGNTSSESVKSTTNVKSDAYINQNGQFLGETIRDANNVIIGIKFTQQS